MDIGLALILLLISLMVLDQFSHLTITNVIKVSDAKGYGKTTVGFILLAISTSLPELSVAFIASLGGDAAISAGNVIGSNIVNICLVIGLSTFLVALRRPNAPSIVSPSAREEFGSLYFGLFVASIIPLSLVYIVGANSFIGFILILLFVFYAVQLLRKVKIPTEDGAKFSGAINKNLRPYVLLTLLGVAGVLVSAFFIVESAVAIAEPAGVPTNLIGGTIIALGTSMPKFFIDTNAFLKGHSTLAFGDIVGSCFLNITLILGITLLIPAFLGSPLTMNMRVFLSLVVFSLMSNLFLWYFLSVGKLGWREGAVLLFIYLLFLATSLGAIQLRVQ